MCQPGPAHLRTLHPTNAPQGGYYSCRFAVEKTEGTGVNMLLRDDLWGTGSWEATPYSVRAFILCVSTARTIFSASALEARLSFPLRSPILVAVTCRAFLAPLSPHSQLVTKSCPSTEAAPMAGRGGGWELQACPSSLPCRPPPGKVLRTQTPSREHLLPRKPDPGTAPVQSPDSPVHCPASLIIHPLARHVSASPRVQHYPVLRLSF